MDSEEASQMTCEECGHSGPAEEFLDFPEELSFVSYQCPDCGYADIG